MPEKATSTARMEAFSDGVIAVIITIMVLELKVPHQNGLAGLRAILPIVLIYLISFTFTAIYWMNHQHLVERVTKADALILYANFLFLFCLSLLPFVTSYAIEKEREPFAVSLYAVSMVVIGFAFLLFRLAIDRHCRLRGTLQKEDKSERHKHLASLLLYLGAAAVAQWHSRIALGIVALVTVIWTLPEIGLDKERTGS